MNVNVDDIGGNVSILVDRLKAGHEIVLEENGVQLARVIPIEPSLQQYGRFGAMNGDIELADDFDGALPKDIADAFGMLDIE